MPKVEFANLICKFGQYNMVDFLEEIIMPSFLDEKLERKYGYTRYFFLNQKLIAKKVDESTDVLLVGRIVKDTILSSEQRYDENRGLVKYERHMEPVQESSIE